MPCPDALEPWFISSAHTDEDVALTLQAFDEALADTVFVTQVALLGAGIIGRVIARDLATWDRPDEVAVGDLDLERSQGGRREITDSMGSG